MKKLSFIIMPLIAIFLLASCGCSKPQDAEHFVTFESNGGSHIETQRVKDGEKATPPETPIKDNDKFLGWFTDFNEEYTFTEVVTADITLYAGWEKAPDPKTFHHFKFTGTGCKINGSNTYECNVVVGDQTQFAIATDEKYSLPTDDPEHFKILKGENVVYEANTGLIKISNMISDIEIVAIGVTSSYFKFDFTGTNCTINGEPKFVQENIQAGTNLKYTIQAKEGYVLPDSIEIPTDVQSFTTYKNGLITITGMAANVVLNVSITKTTTHNFIFIGHHCKMNNSNKVEEEIFADATTQRSVHAIEGYDLVGATITIEGDGKSKVTYSEGVFTIDHLDGDVKIEVTAKPKVCRVTFNPGEGKLIKGAREYIDIEYGKKFSELENIDSQKAIYPSYNFYGWALTATDRMPLGVDNDYTIKEDLEVYAIFVAENTVKLTFEGVHCGLYKNNVKQERTIDIVSGEYATFTIKPTEPYLPIFLEPVTCPNALLYDFNPINKQLKIIATEDCVVTASTTKQSLEECTWKEISSISSAGMASYMFEIGDTKKVTLNGLEHLVRIIDFDKDKDSRGNPVGITFEFATLISKDEGEAITTLWNCDQGDKSTNYNYPESTLNIFLNDTGDPNSVINMLPSDPTNKDLKEVIKEVNKNVGINEVGGEYDPSNYIAKPYKTKLFPLAYVEFTSNIVWEEENIPGEGNDDEIEPRYQFYKHEIAKNRIKKAVNGVAEYYFTRSPSLDGSDLFFRVDNVGDIRFDYNVYDLYFAIAPAFCV
ncbi:MAG: InlB B-repeat-containing protein [Bacilli bacterium]|nr:InlB B-repeat-containing protein [Bacilli bacterium]